MNTKHRSCKDFLVKIFRRLSIKASTNVANETEKRLQKRFFCNLVKKYPL